LTLLGAAGAAQSHVASNGFLTLEVDGARASGVIEIAIRDAELAVGLDANRDGRVTWREVRAAQAPLGRYLAQHLQLAGRDGRCALQLGALEINERTDGNYIWQPFTAACAGPLDELTIGYRLMDTEDPSHRGLLTLTAFGESQTGVLGGPNGAQSFDLTHPSAWHAFTQYLMAGVWHIWSGIDHLLFLLSLLLPAVLVRRNHRWDAVPRAAPAFMNILKVVTAFTVAHSITLSLAAFDVIRLPSRFTESMIAGVHHPGCAQQRVSAHHRCPLAGRLRLRPVAWVRLRVGARRHGPPARRPAGVARGLQSRRRSGAVGGGARRHAPGFRAALHEVLSPRGHPVGIDGHRRAGVRMVHAAGDRLRLRRPRCSDRATPARRAIAMRAVR
jgi:hypothetical protein